MNCCRVIDSSTGKRGGHRDGRFAWRMTTMGLQKYRRFAALLHGKEAEPKTGYLLALNLANARARMLVDVKHFGVHVDCVAASFELVRPPYWLDTVVSRKEIVSVVRVVVILLVIVPVSKRCVVDVRLEGHLPVRHGHMMPRLCRGRETLL